VSRPMCPNTDKRRYSDYSGFKSVFDFAQLYGQLLLFLDRRPAILHALSSISTFISEQINDDDDDR